MLNAVKNSRGLTLIEMMVAIGLTAIVGLALQKVFDTQNKLYSGENKVVEMHDQARLGMQTLAQGVRLAGYDPGETGMTTFGLTSSAWSTSSSAAIAANNTIYFTIDLDESGTLNATNEFVAYRLSGTDLQAVVVSDTSGTVVGWRTVASDITSLAFKYGYEDGTDSDTSGLPDNATTNYAFSKVRTVTITLSAQMRAHHDLKGSTDTEIKSTLVKLRNVTALRL